MNVDGTITIMLQEVEQEIMTALGKGTHSKIWKESLALEEKLLQQDDSSDLRHFIRLALEIREIERCAAQFAGIAVGLRLNQIVSGKDIDALFDYCVNEFDNVVDENK